MAPVYIATRIVKDGKRYQVKYRRGGRGYRIEHGGTFRTLTEARGRRDLIAGWLANGKDPRAELAALQAVVAPLRPVREWAEAFAASRIDVTASTARNYRVAFLHVNERFGDRDPATITVSDVREFVGYLVNDAKLSPGSIGVYMGTFRQLLDFVGLEPNVARDKSVKLPSVERVEPTPPSAAHVLAIVEHARKSFRLPIVVMEQTAMRTGEVESLRWEDVDIDGNRFRLRARRTKTSRARWVQVPDWLMDLIVAGTPPDDRGGDRRVFPAYTSETALYVVRRACVLAGIPHYHPHDFRHRRASLWHAQGATVAELKERGGWTTSDVPLDTYSHVLIDDTEVAAGSFLAVLAR